MRTSPFQTLFFSLIHHLLVSLAPMLDHLENVLKKYANEGPFFFGKSVSMVSGLCCIYIVQIKRLIFLFIFVLCKDHQGFWHHSMCNFLCLCERIAHSTFLCQVDMIYIPFLERAEISFPSNYDSKVGRPHLAKWIEVILLLPAKLCFSPPNIRIMQLFFMQCFFIALALYSIAISPWNIYFLFSLDILASLMSESIINYIK
jgi:hypothetical protein